jgi:exonuclease SbcC
MRLKSVDLTNVCQHEKLYLEFEPGITGITAPNGSGKSNAVNMIQASLTGDFGVNPGKKEANIRHDAPEDAVSKIVTEWEHDGIPFSITRGLRPASQKLVIGDKKWSKANEISDELTKFIGIDRHVIENFMFVQQWSTFSILVSDPAERQKSFAKLCGVDRAEQIWSMLGKQISADQGLASQVDDNRDELKEKIKEQKKRMAAAQEKIKELETFVLSPEDLEAAEKQVTDWGMRQRLLQDLEKAQERQALVAGKIIKLYAKLRALDDEYEPAREAVDTKLQPEYKALKAKYDEQQANRKFDVQRQKYEAVLLKKAPTVIDEPPEYVHSKALASRAGDLDTQKKVLAKRVAVFEEGGVSECPTCGTLVSDMENGVEHWTKEMKRLQAEYDAVIKQYRISDGYERALADYEKQLKAYNAEMESARLALAKLPPPVEVDEEINAADVGTANAELQEAIQYVEDLELQCNTARKLIAQEEGSAAELERQVKTLGGQIVKLKVSEKDYEAAVNAIAVHKQVSQDLWKHKSALSVASKLVDEYKSGIQRITTLIARTQSAQLWLSDLALWRDVFHREALPRIVTQTRVEGMVDSVNETLELFNGPFRVSVEDKLTFMAHKPRGYVEEAARLSGGEKVILGIAFRFSVAGQVGLMVLDEPTAGLDGDNIECLVDMLEHVSEVTREKGQQVIIITHDHRLERVFDNKIEIRRN